MLSTHLFLALASFTTLASAKYIQDLTNSEFTEHIHSNQRSLVAFTSSSSDSKLSSFNTVFATTAQNFTTPFISIDCDTESELCAHHDINALPTIRFYSRKTGEEDEGKDTEPEMTRYRGPRSSTSIHSFILKRELPTSTHLQTTEELQSFKTIDTRVVIAYLRPDQTQLLSAFQSVASRYYTDVVFGYSTDSASADEERVSVPSIMLYKNDDGDHKVANGYFSEADIVSLIEGSKDGVTRPFKERTAEEFMQRDKLTVYIFVPATSEAEEHLRTIRHALTPLARKYLKYTIFTTVDMARYAEMARNFGVEVERDPAIVVHAPMNDNVFLYRQGDEMDAGSVENMLTTILHGKAVNGQMFESIERAVRKEKGHEEL